MNTNVLAFVAVALMWACVVMAAGLESGAPALQSREDRALLEALADAQRPDLTPAREAEVRATIEAHNARRPEVTIWMP